MSDGTKTPWRNLAATRSQRDPEDHGGDREGHLRRVDPDAYLASLADADLSREVDLSAMGMGNQTVGFVLDNALLGHAFCHCGEISALKGVQGKKGYPF